MVCRNDFSFWHFKTVDTNIDEVLAVFAPIPAVTVTQSGAVCSCLSRCRISRSKRSHVQSLGWPRTTFGISLDELNNAVKERPGRLGFPAQAAASATRPRRRWMDGFGIFPGKPESRARHFTITSHHHYHFTAAVMANAQIIFHFTRWALNNALGLSTQNL